MVKTTYTVICTKGEMQKLFIDFLNTLKKRTVFKVKRDELKKYEIIVTDITETNKKVVYEVF